MKYVFGLVCVVAVGVMPVMGCSDSSGDGGSPGTGGSGGSAGTGGSAGDGGSGGAGEDECTNAEDTAVYDALEYNTGSEALMGPEAASQIASDCVFGNLQAEPSNPGCGQEAQAVLVCGGANCPDETIQDLSDCVVACQQQVIEEATGETLSQRCADCYGESVTCSAVNCATAGCTVPDSAQCVACRCANDCTPGFDRCSGLPSQGTCN